MKKTYDLPLEQLFSIRCPPQLPWQNTIWAATWENRMFAYHAKTKTQVSFALTAKLITAFVFATWIEQHLYFLNPKFPVSSYIQ